jgi:DNA-binding CsgD family transcriptional regulator
MLAALGFEHVMYSVTILDDDGLFSGISLKRKAGRENFSPLEQRIAHIVTSEIEWLHYDEKLATVTGQIRTLSPRQRTVVTLLMEGLSIKQIAIRLGCSPNTVKDHCKAIYAHFRVHSRRELFRRFTAGDGHDLGREFKS